MSDLSTGAALAALVVLAFLLARLPRPLFAEAAGAALPRGERAGLYLALAAAGLVAFAAGLGHTLPGRAAFGAAMMALAGVVYSDLRFLVIPDLYSGLILVLALIAPWRPELLQAVLGLGVCGGLLAVLALAWRRMTKADGLGLGDVKLAGALGALLGAQQGLFAISTSAAGAAVLTLAAGALQRRGKAADAGQGPMLAPYGAALAVTSAGFLVYRLAGLA